MNKNILQYGWLDCLFIPCNWFPTYAKIVSTNLPCLERFGSQKDLRFSCLAAQQDKMIITFELYTHIIYIHVDHISIKPTTYLNIDAKNLAHSNSNSEILRLLIDIALGIVCGLAGGFWVKCHGYTAGRLKRWRLRESEPEAPTGPTGPRRVAGWSPTMWGPQT